MPDDTFQVNLSRLIAAQLFFLLRMTASREMYGKSYFALGHGEKTALDQTVLTFVGKNFQGLTPEFLKAQQTGQQIGFQPVQPSAPQPSPPGKS